MAVGAVRVHGLKELQRVWDLMPPEIADEFRDELIEAADPVRKNAEQKAEVVLTWTIGKPQHAAYTAMRVGVSRAQTLVYVVPSYRSRGARLSPRAKEAFVRRMQKRALEPALEQNRQQIEGRVDNMLDRIAADNGF